MDICNDSSMAWECNLANQFSNQLYNEIPLCESIIVQEIWSNVHACLLLLAKVLLWYQSSFSHSAGRQTNVRDDSS